VPPIFAPNAFSPNNDGLNDCWKATPESSITNYELIIFSRWGDKIFYTTNVNACWDGTCKGVPQDPGNYVYRIKYGNNCLKNTESGNLLLLR
jgi:gliding motility-associated-like protein